MRTKERHNPEIPSKEQEIDHETRVELRGVGGGGKEAM